MNELDKDKIDKHITCIIEDYKALKSEISRRSDLQRFALLAYGGVVGVILKSNAETNFSSFQILLVWLTSSIAYLFYFSEDDFIKRLSKIINFNGSLFSYLLLQHNISYSKLIEEELEYQPKKLNIKQQNITLKNVVFPSESPVINKIIKGGKLAKFFNVLFLAFYLIFLPLIINIYYLDGDYQSFFVLDNWESIVIFICFLANFCISICLFCANFF